MNSTTSSSGKPRTRVVKAATGQPSQGLPLSSAALKASASTMPPAREARASPRVIQVASSSRLSMAYWAKYLSKIC